MSKQRRTREVRWLRVGAAVLVLGGGAVVGVDPTGAQPADDKAYIAEVEVLRATGVPTDGSVRGTVFHDGNHDGEHQGDEAGIPDVMVSNSREVVRTDDEGRYELPAFDGMTVFVTQPAGYAVPVDEHNFPQFFYHHLPEGSPDLRFGGLAPTGPLPEAVNFPLAEADASDEVDCAIIGDTQTYSNRELGYLRDGVVADLGERDDLERCGALIVGDVAGDDLGLYPRIKEVMSAPGIPVRAVPGNHDIDFDATDDEHSFDTYKREIGPAYYSYDVGQAHFVGLDNVRYPCTPEVDNADGEHEFCDDPANHPTYNGVIGEEQLTWLANDLAHVPKDKLIIIATHIPLVSFIDMGSNKHQTNDAPALYELLEGRPALSVVGHAQTVENLETGDTFGPWKEAVGVDAVPFPHITVGAASGSWWTGDLDTNGIPESLQRGGAPAGYINLALDGNTFQDTYRATGRDEDEQMSVSISSPFYREWFSTLMAWKEANPDATTEPPPLNINDLGDPNLLTHQDLSHEGSDLMVNLWNGSTDSRVDVQIDGGAPAAATRTQEAQGEDIRSGAEYSDPFAAMRQLMVARHSFASTSGNERAQGWEAYRGDKFGPGPAQPISPNLVTDQSSHLWRLPLPEDLAAGSHTATVTATDQHGRTYQDTLVFEVVDERPPPFFRTELFEEPAG